MRFKITYAKGTELAKLVIEAATLNEAMRNGYSQTQWDSVLEITTADDKTIQGVA
jgi:hypothetical protein